jgi:hypothetical protein
MCDHDNYYSMTHQARLFNTDFIEISALASVASVTVTVSGVMLNVNGEESRFSYSLSPNATRTISTLQADLGPGVLLHVQSSVTPSTVKPGEVYVRARIVRNATSEATPQMLLFSGYVSSLYQPSFPLTDSITPSPLRGVIKSVTGTDPAAGAECSDTVPANALWRLHGWRASLVTSAAATTRQVMLQVTDGATVVMETPANGTQGASLTRAYSALESVSAPAGVGSSLFIALPSEMVIPAGYVIRTSTSGLDVGDNWGAPQLTVEEWLYA